MGKRIYTMLFFFILVIVFFLYNYYEILFYPPYSIHTWRQADCLSITLNFYKEKLSFFTPKIHWTNEVGDNYVISEFPIIYYIVAKLWSLFGQKEFIFRLVNIAFVVSGLYSLFLFSKLFLKNNFWAIFVPLFLFTSPILVYYTNNFMADAPAFGMALTALLFFYLFYETDKWKYLILSIVFISLAGLLKISSLIFFIAFSILIVLQCILQVYKKKPLSRKHLKIIFSFLLVSLIMVGWYSYARHFSNNHLGGIFLQSIYPIWDLNGIERKNITDSLYWKLLPAFFNKKALAMLLVIYIATIILSYKKFRKHIVLLLISGVGITLFILLWYKAFNVHDYYLTNLLFIIPLILILFLYAIKAKFYKLFNHWALKILATIGLLILIYQTTIINRLKYDSHDPWLKANVFLKSNEIELWKGSHWRYEKNLKSVETIQPYLRSLGIKREDLVYSTPDNTINHTLYLMDQRGFTEYGYVPYKGLEKYNQRIDYYISIGAKYLIVNNSDVLQYIDEKYLKNCIGNYENVFIYKLI